MARTGRPKKKEEDLIKNQLVAIDYADYIKIKVKSEETQEPIKVIIKKLVKNIYDIDNRKIYKQIF